MVVEILADVEGEGDLFVRLRVTSNSFKFCFYCPAHRVSVDFPIAVGLLEDLSPFFFSLLLPPFLVMVSIRMVSMSRSGSFADSV